MSLRIFSVLYYVSTFTQSVSHLVVTNSHMHTHNNIHFLTPDCINFTTECFLCTDQNYNCCIYIHQFLAYGIAWFPIYTDQNYNNRGILTGCQPEAFMEINFRTFMMYAFEVG